MRLHLAISLILATLILVACDSGGKSGENVAASPPKLFETQRNALDKARGVEDNVQQQAQEQKQDAERQTE